MSEEQRKTVWPWIVVVLVVLPVLYVGGFGPACQLTDRGILPSEFTHQLYYPLGVCIANCGSESICSFMIDLGMEDGVDLGALQTAPAIIYGAFIKNR